MTHGPRALILLAFGAVVAFLVSASLALARGAPADLTLRVVNKGHSSGLDWWISTDARPGLTRYRVDFRAHDRDTPLSGLSSPHPLPWSGLAEPWHAPASNGVPWDRSHRHAMAAGWPFLAFGAELSRDCSTTEADFPVSDNRVLWGVTVSVPSWVAARIAGSDTFTIPLRPLWLGLIANSCLYAVLGWLLVAAVTKWRFVRRERRGCPRCGYPMKEMSTCSECGWRKSPPRPVLWRLAKALQLTRAP